MMGAYAQLQNIKEAISSTNIFKSVEIGLEVGLSAKDMDACRIRLKTQEIEEIEETRSIEIHLFVDTKNDKDSMHKKTIEIVNVIMMKLHPNQPTSIIYDNQTDTVFSSATLYYSFKETIEPSYEDCRYSL